MLAILAPHFPARDWRHAPDAALPAADPHGRAWASLSAAQLQEAAGFCMTDDQHEACRRALVDVEQRAAA